MFKRIQRKCCMWVLLLSLILMESITIQASSISQDARGRVKIPQSEIVVTATSEQVGYEVEKAFDGDKQTLWKAAANSPQSIIMDLGGTYTQTLQQLVEDVRNSTSTLV